MAKVFVAVNNPSTPFAAAGDEWEVGTSGIAIDNTSTAGNRNVYAYSNIYGPTGWSGILDHYDDVGGAVPPCMATGHWNYTKIAVVVNNTYLGNDAQRKMVATHELGHFLGLAHNNATSLVLRRAGKRTPSCTSLTRERRETAQCLPRSPMTGMESMFSTDHAHRIAAAAALAVLTAGCGSSHSSPSSSEAISSALRSVELDDGGMVSRVAEYTSVKELGGASDLVVVATAGDSKQHPTSTGEGPQLSFVDVQFTVDKVVGGTPPIGDGLSVFAEDADKFVSGSTYLLFLTRWPDQPLYAVTGYLAGMYRQVELPGGRRAFGRVDPESPALPQGIDVTGGDIASLRPLG